LPRIVPPLSRKLVWILPAPRDAAPRDLHELGRRLERDVEEPSIAVDRLLERAYTA